MKYSLLSLFLFFPFFSFAQNLSLANLLELKKKNLADAEYYLTTKDWALESSTKSSKDYMSILTFSYKKNYDETATSFLYYFTSEYYKENRINIQVHTAKKYLELLNTVRKMNIKLIKSAVSDSRIHNIYQGKTTTFWFTVDNTRDKTVWYLFILDNVDYNIQYSDNDLTVDIQ